MWPPGASAGSKTAKPRAALNTRFVRYIFRLAAGAIGEAQRRGLGEGSLLTSMTESALSTNLSVFLPSNEMVGQGWISVCLSYPWHLRDCSSNAATVEPGGVVLRGASPANRASQPSSGLDDRFLTRSQGQASPAARAQGCQGGRGRSDLRAPSSRDVRATIF